MYRQNTDEITGIHLSISSLDFSIGHDCLVAIGKSYTFSAAMSPARPGSKY